MGSPQDARIALLARLIDHAPHFPPASLEPANAFRRRDRCAEAGELVNARRERVHAIGSCSLFEPVEELDALGGLPL